MNIKNLKIKTQIIGVFSVSILVLVVSSIVIFVNLNKIKRISAIEDEANHLMVSMLYARRHEKDFFLRKDLQYVEKHKQTILMMNEHCAALLDFKWNNELGLRIEEIKTLIRNYERLFGEVVALWEEKGLDENSGLRGMFRDKTHELEERIDKTKLSSSITAQLLLCRRREKDYIIRGEEKYVAQFEKDVEILKEMLRSAGANDLNGLVDGYSTQFIAMRENDEKIKRKVDAFRNEIHKLEPIHEKIHEEINRYAEMTYAGIRNTILFLLSLALLISVIAASILIVTITGQVDRIVRWVTRLKGGELDALSGIDSKNELGIMVKAMEDMAAELGKTLADAKVKADILDGLFSPIIAVDSHMNITLLNKAAARLGGREPSQYIGTKCFDLFKTEDCNTDGCALVRSMRSGKPETGRTVARPSGGGEIPIMYTGAPLYDEKGKINGAVETVTDISKIASMQSEVRRQVQTLSAAVEELSTMAKDMDDRSSGIAQNSSAMAAAAEEVGTNMGSVSDRVADVQNNLTTVSSSAEEMSATVTDIARNAHSAQSTTNDAVKRVGTIEREVDELGRASESISSVVGTIVEIAEQTKLLALNATIEAARAGEAGKGFAVVAGEVKELAKQTNEATVDIQKKIEKIAGSTSQTIDEIKNISGVIKNVNEIVTTIAAAVEQQAVTTRDIASNIGTAATGMQEITNTVTEAANASQSIAQNVSEMTHDIGDVRDSASGLNNASTSLAEVSMRLNEEVDNLAK